MAVSLYHRAVPPRKETPKKPMPKGPGVHINIHFGGETAERGRKVADLETDRKVIARRSSPPPAPEKDEQERPTYNPNPDEIKAQRVQNLIQQSAHPIEEVNQDDMPTYEPPGRRKPNTSTAAALEEKILSRDSDVSRLTTSFAPPPPIKIVEENIATQIRDNVVPIAVAADWIPPRKRKQQEKSRSTGINPNGKEWTFDDAVQDSLVMPHANCGVGSK